MGPGEYLRGTTTAIDSGMTVKLKSGTIIRPTISQMQKKRTKIQEIAQTTKSKLMNSRNAREANNLSNSTESIIPAPGHDASLSINNTHFETD